MAPRLASLDVYDVRFPTSRFLDGSDAVNVDPEDGPRALEEVRQAGGVLE